MATIIESLLVELGIDPAGMTKGQKESTDSLKKLEESANKTMKTLETQSKKAGIAIAKLRNNLIAALTVFTAGTGLKQFFTQTTDADAATGRLARNLEMSVGELTAWQGVAERAGGTADGMANSMQGLVQNFQQLALTGQSQVIPFFRAVGVQIADSQGHLRPMAEILLEVADKFHGMPAAQAQALGRGMGFDEGTVNVLIKGRRAIQDLLREQERLGHANEEDTRAAEERQKVLRGLGQALTSVGRIILTIITPAVIVLTEKLTDLAAWFKTHPQVAVAAVTTLTVAIVGLSTAMAVGAVAAFAKMAAAGIAAFASMVVAAAPLIATVALLAAVGYGAYAGTTWLMENSLIDAIDDLAPDRGDRDKRKLPRGIRNNNPGNLNYAGQAGATKESGPDGRFAVFSSMSEGIKALAMQIKRYDAQGIDSVREIISKFAPPNENNTQAYIKSVAARLKKDPDAPLNLNDNNTLKALIEAIIAIEVGKGQVNSDVINSALQARASASISSRPSNNSKSETNIGQITIQTAATDAKGIMNGAASAAKQSFGMAQQANYGLT